MNEYKVNNMFDSTFVQMQKERQKKNAEFVQNWHKQK